MAKSPDAPKCREPGCGQPVAVNPATGNPCLNCPAHFAAPLTVREQIAQGPKFEPMADDAACAACGVLGCVDKATGLCQRLCWSNWRWSCCREREAPAR